MARIVDGCNFIWLFHWHRKRILLIVCENETILKKSHGGVLFLNWSTSHKINLDLLALKRVEVCINKQSVLKYHTQTHHFCYAESIQTLILGICVNTNRTLREWSRDQSLLQKAIMETERTCELCERIAPNELLKAAMHLPNHRSQQTESDVCMAERKSLSPTGRYWPYWSNVPRLHLKLNFIPRKHRSVCTLFELGFLFINLPLAAKCFYRKMTAINVYRAYVCRTTAKNPTIADHQGITKTN